MDNLSESLQLPPHIIHVDFPVGDLDILQNRTEFDEELSESLHQFRVDRHPDIPPIDDEHDLRKGIRIALCLTIEFGDYLQSDKDIAFPEGHEALFPNGFGDRSSRAQKLDRPVLYSV